MKQLAWQSTFEQRKAQALELQLAEEAAERRQMEEDAAALAAEREALAKEQAHKMAELKKREATRLRAERQLEALQLPNASRWGVGATGVTSQSTPAAANLLAIQADQALELVSGGCVVRMRWMEWVDHLCSVTSPPNVCVGAGRKSIVFACIGLCEVSVSEVLSANPFRICN